MIEICKPLYTVYGIDCIQNWPQCFVIVSKKIISKKPARIYHSTQVSLWNYFPLLVIWIVERRSSHPSVLSTANNLRGNKSSSIEEACISIHAVVRRELIELPSQISILPVQLTMPIFAWLLLNFSLENYEISYPSSECPIDFQCGDPYQKRPSPRRCIHPGGLRTRMQ